MNGRVLQSTLRELKGIATSRNLWLTFGAVVLLFALTGPFGTTEELRFLPRLGYWLVLHFLAWSSALVFAVLGGTLLRRFIDSLFRRMMIGAVLAAIPIGLITQGLQYAWFGRLPEGASLLGDIALAVPLCAIFCVISYMTMSAESLSRGQPPEAAVAPFTETGETAGAGPATADNADTPSLLRRLRPENRGTLQHIAVEDHYTMVRTSRGSELILLRFSDALSETGASAGLQVHRSHWVADSFVSRLNRANGKLSLVLGDGSEIPVSRTYAAEVRSRFG